VYALPQHVLPLAGGRHTREAPGWVGALAALGTGVAQTCVYEFFHCIQHLGYQPRWGWVLPAGRLQTGSILDDGVALSLRAAAW